MIYVIPSCFESFSCIASQCPDTCCRGWEVDLDQDILSFYSTMPGSLGEEIRGKIHTEEGYTFFQMDQGRCPFLNEKNLCRLILEAGEHCLSTTCREHPRFWEEYGDRQETCLAISCPEAARLLLESPFRLSLREDTLEPEPDPELDQDLLTGLLSLREELFLLASSTAPLPQRFADILRRIQIPALPPCSGYLQEMTKMEFTDQRLQNYLRRTLEHMPREADRNTLFNIYSREGENLLLYFLYRYVLRGVWDGLIQEKILFSLCSVLAIFTIAVAQDGPFRENLLWSSILYSREVEHSPENLELLYGYCSGGF